MTIMLPAGAGIDEEILAASAPQVRALLVQRLELVWRACEPQYTDPDVKPDPRYIEAAIRGVDRYQKLYRLDHPQPAENRGTQPSQVSARDQLKTDLLALEARLTGGDVVVG